MRHQVFCFSGLQPGTRYTIALPSDVLCLFKPAGVFRTLTKRPQVRV
jgi:hypothetical protein